MRPWYIAVQFPDDGPEEPADQTVTFFRDQEAALDFADTLNDEASEFGERVHYHLFELTEVDV